MHFLLRHCLAIDWKKTGLSHVLIRHFKHGLTVVYRDNV